MKKLIYIFIFMFFISYLPTIAQRSTEYLKREGLAHMQQGKYGEAIDKFNKFIAANPRLAEGYNLRGLCFEQRKEYSYSVLDFRRARKLDPDNAEIQKNLARVLSIWHAILYERIEGFKREIAIDPSFPFNYLEIGKSYRWLEEWALAEQWYDEYLARDDDASPDEIIRYTEILAKTGSITKGERILRKFVQRYPDDWRLWSRYGYFTMWLGNYDRAKDAFERALSFKPFFKEAQDGLDLATRKGYLTQAQPRAFEKVYPIDRFYRLLKKDPGDVESRYALVDELISEKRYEEAWQQLGILSDAEAESDRFQEYYQRIETIRDSLFQSDVERYSADAKLNPRDKEAILNLASAYGNLYAFDDAIEILEEFLYTSDENGDLDIRYKLGQYAAWNYEWEKAIDQLDILLRNDPNNLDYQLLRGQISVWTVLELDEAKVYLNNVIAARPNNLYALLALVTLHSWQKDFITAKYYLDRAKQIAPDSPEIDAAESNYFLHLSAGEELQLMQIRKEAGDLAYDGRCEEALDLYDEYLSKRTGPNRQESKEYAWINVCVENYDTALDIYNELLDEEYEYDAALQRAKIYLITGDSLTALDELKKLYNEDPENFEMRMYLGSAYGKVGELDKAIEIYEELLLETDDPDKLELLHQGSFQTKLFIADTYMNLKEYGEAEDLYEDLKELTSDSTEIAMLNQRISWIPPYGFSGALGDLFEIIVPKYMALSPSANYYTDNQNLSFANYGGRLDLGFSQVVSLGASWFRTYLKNESAHRYLTTFKGHLALRFSEFVSLGGGYGQVFTPGFDKKPVYDAYFRYQDEERLSIYTLYEHSDARTILYSPNLLDIDYNVDMIRLGAAYEHKSRLKISGYFQYISVSDNNEGNDFQFRVGRGFLEDIYVGYEYFFSDYGFSSSLYFSPQHFESHSIWADWIIHDKNNLKVTTGGKLGYVPAVDFIINEVYGNFSYQPYQYLIINGRATFGNSYRFDASYKYFSAMLSAYWSIY